MVRAAEMGSVKAVMATSAMKMASSVEVPPATVAPTVAAASVTTTSMPTTASVAAASMTTAATAERGAR